MRRIVPAFLITMLVAEPAALAADPPVPGPSGSTLPAARTSSDGSGLAAAGAREVARLLSAAQGAPASARQQGSPQTRGWIGRHPVIFGTLVGAGAGAIAAGTMENEMFCSGGDEDCFFHGGGRVVVGAGFGAGIGALTGLLVAAGRD